ncbi:hypothetical protein [Bradyrhizobium sp. SSUT77]|uniref:hypothetical protein n=1 Tax=Bradyrhizobium sp. SSUT77 TaxID=3040603 RepID=UPI002449446C|nr:hypothetical protein [Bradyrhizobium sp. SSUT77]MDH2348306.1 hypothetical protein [Bradyrhizobium sp. SSUT77]
MNLQVTVLKILVSYPDGFAPMAELKRDMAILATSGPDWAERTKRLAARVPDLDIFSQQLIERVNGGWRITERGRAVLNVMEARSIPTEVKPEIEVTAAETPKSVLTQSLPVEEGRGQREPRQRRRLPGTEGAPPDLSPAFFILRKAIRG